jgi:hypothetical protein
MVKVEGADGLGESFLFYMRHGGRGSSCRFKPELGRNKISRALRAGGSTSPRNIRLGGDAEVVPSEISWSRELDTSASRASSGRKELFACSMPVEWGFPKGIFPGMRAQATGSGGCAHVESFTEGDAVAEMTRPKQIRRRSSRDSPCAEAGSHGMARSTLDAESSYSI